MVGTFAIVGCDENPNFQVWGAKSDLGCKKKKKNKVIKMKFKDWIELKEQDQKIDLKTFFNKFKKDKQQLQKQTNNKPTQGGHNTHRHTNKNVQFNKVINNGQQN